MIREDIKTWIQTTLSVDGVFSVDHPKDMSHGDYAVNVALIEGKKQGKNPKELAEEYAEALRQAQGNFAFLSKIEVAGPGFINIFLTKDFFTETIGTVLNTGETFGENIVLNKQKTIIEYTNCNVLKPMHIGHLMGNIIGESLSRIVAANGAEIKRDTYQGDSGLHIAKTVWGINSLGGLREGSVAENIDYIGQAYALGANKYEDDPAVQEEIKKINQQIFEKTDSSLHATYEWARQVSLDHFEELYKKLGTTFDFKLFESEVAADALKIVSEYKEKGVFEEGDGGAIVFHGEKYDPKLHTRVFVSGQGIPMYEAKDIVHAIRKYKTYASDKSIVLTANEQDGYFKVMLRALKEIDPQVADQTRHLSHGLLKLPDGKMSSRKGNIITAEGLIDLVQNLVLEKMADREMTDDVKKEVSEIIAIGAIKYSILKQAIGGDIIFDFDKSLSFEGDSGPYLQYSAVRAKSVLERAQFSISNFQFSIPESWNTTGLEKMLARFPEVVERAGSEYAPHYIATYLTELASSFNSFYAEHKIIDEQDVTSPYRIALTKSFGIVMKNGLHLLGIKVPQEM